MTDKKPSKRASAPKSKPAKPTTSTARRTREDGEETAIDIVRRHAAANPKLTFSKVCELAVKDGVKPNTARGALVRIKANRQGGAK